MTHGHNKKEYGVAVCTLPWTEVAVLCVVLLLIVAESYQPAVAAAGVTFFHIRVVSETVFVIQSAAASTIIAEQNMQETSGIV